MNFPILFCSAYMHCLKDSSGIYISQLQNYSNLDDLQAFKTGPLDDPIDDYLELGEKKKCMRRLIKWTGKLLQFIESRTRSAGCLRRCEQVYYYCEPATICFATTLVSSYALNKAYYVWSPYRLTEGSSGSVSRTRCRSYSTDQSSWSTCLWLWLSCFHRYRKWQTFPLTVLALSLWVVLKNLCLILSDDSTKYILFGLKTLDEVLVAPLLIINSCLGTIFTQTIRMPNASVIIFQTFFAQLTGDHSNGRPTITTHYLPYPLDVDLNLAS